MNRPETLSRLASEVDGTLPDMPEPRLPQGAETRPRTAFLDPSATAVVLSTSEASTGNPVQLAKRFDQLEAELSAHARLWPLVDSGVISQVSHQHIYGLLTGILHPLCAGAPFCGGESRYPEALMARLQEADTAGLHPVVVSSPAQLSRLPEHLPWHAATPPARVFYRVHPWRWHMLSLLNACYRRRSSRFMAVPKRAALPSVAKHAVPAGSRCPAWSYRFKTVA